MWVGLIEKEETSTRSLFSLLLPCLPHSTNEANQITSSISTSFLFKARGVGNAIILSLKERSTHIFLLVSLLKADVKSAVLPTFQDPSYYISGPLSRHTGLIVLSL